MRKLNPFFLAVMVLCCAFTQFSCNSDDEDTTPTPTSTEGMTAKIDGTNWSADIYGGTIYNGYTNISGRTNAGETITITLSGDDVGTYTLSQNSLHAGAYTEAVGTNALTSNGSPMGGGTVIISEINTTEKWISGTFDFDVIRATDNETRAITDGKFTKVPYTTDPPSGGSSNLSVMIDGSEWVATSTTAVAAFGNITVTSLSNNDNYNVGITVPADATTGTYDFNFGGPYIGQLNVGQSVFMSAESGSITITEHNTSTRTLTGTFNFIARDFNTNDSNTLTNGSFSATY